MQGWGTRGAVPKQMCMPSLTISERAGRVHLKLGSFACGDGMSLQEAADDLIQSLLGLALAVRSGGFTASREVLADLETMSYLAELGELAAAGGEIRSRVFS